MNKTIKTIWNSMTRHNGDLSDLPVDCSGTRGGRKVILALDLIKCQRHKVDLNARANQGFIENFRNKLRQTAQARKLCALRRDLPMWQRAYYLNSWMVNLAACFLLVFIAKMHFGSLTRHSVNFSEKKISQIYAKQCGGDKELLDIFKAMRGSDNESDQTIV